MPRTPAERVRLAQLGARLSEDRALALYGCVTPERLPRGLPDASPAGRKKVAALLLRLARAEHDAL